ncbi:MAG: acyl-CoA dehydrogenase family protein, partial [Nitrospinota bacterium]
GCFPWDVLKEFSSLGLKRLPLPESYGGGEMGVLTHCILLEELMAAEAGFAAAVHGAWKLAGLLIECGTEEQVSKYIQIYAEDDTCLMGDGTTDPAVGPADLLAHKGAEGGCRLMAVREGSGWVLDGKKRFVASGAIAKLFFIDARTNGRVPDSEGMAGFILTKDAPGFRVGRVHDKMGARVLIDAELIFERCRIPGEDVLFAEEGNAHEARARYFGKISPTGGAFGVGIARAALEETIEYARNRVQGGKPIIEHDVVALRLAEMAADVETARALVWKAAWHSDNQRHPEPGVGLAATLFASEIAPRVCDAAIQLFGAYGFMRDYPVQKHWRDALMCYSMHGMNDIVRLKMERHLDGEHI